MFYVLQGSNTEKETLQQLVTNGIFSSEVTLQQLVQLYQISKPRVKFALLANCG